MTGESVPAHHARGRTRTRRDVRCRRGRPRGRHGDRCRYRTGWDRRAVARTIAAGFAVDCRTQSAGTVIATIAVGIGIGFMAVSLLVGMPATDGFLFGVGVTVAARSRGPPADGHAVAGDGRQADGAQPCPRTPPRGGRDARLDDLHLHRQDRDADLQRDVDRRPSGHRAARGWGARRQRLRPDLADRHRTDSGPPPSNCRGGGTALLRRAGRPV